MILWFKNADLRASYQWLDSDDEAITPTAVAFDVTNMQGASVASWTLEDAQLEVDEDDYINLFIDDATDIEAGLYSYRLTATADTDTAIISAGHLRVKESL